MKLYAQLLIALIVIAPCIHAEDRPNSVYQQEIQALKANPIYKPIFDKEAPLDLKLIHRDIENFKELTFLQRLIRFGILGADVVVVTPETMPKLYGYVKTICEEQSVVMRTVFITRQKGVFNAFAQKLLASSGAIVIYQKLIKQTTAKELEAVIAHELGHIKYNHVNKILGMNIAAAVGLKLLAKQFAPSYENHNFTQFIIASYLTRFVINKRFEKQADEFAYKATHDHGKGLIELFEHFDRKEKYNYDHYAITYKALQNNKSKLGYFDYLSLMADYYITKGTHAAYTWIYSQYAIWCTSKSASTYSSSTRASPIIDKYNCIQKRHTLVCLFLLFFGNFTD